MIAILHNIRSIYNTASIFRTADGLGVEKLYLSGYTPAPTDRFGRERDKFQKVSLGAEEAVAFAEIKDITELIENLQSEDVSVFACEPTSDAADYHSVDTSSEACLVFGNEPKGLPDDVIAACDQVVKIPMRGRKSSLNVSVAFGVLSAYFVDSKS